MNPLAAFIPEDRRIALARGESLPDPTRGTALLADISGFTPLTDALTQTLGAQRGGEELIRQINAVYESLIAQVAARGGSVIGFAGDALLCWFDEKDGAGFFSSLRAIACARAMQIAMQSFANIALVNDTRITLAIKIAITRGAARRLIVGNPQIQLIDALAGETPVRVARAEHLARPGEIIADRATLEASGVPAREWRADARGESFAVIEPSDHPGAQSDARASIELTLSDAQLRSWVLPGVYERHRAGVVEFTLELRPVVALFARAADIALAETNALIQRAQEMIARYDGALIQLTFDDHGNYFYATFGALNAHEDDARRAVYAAFDLQKIARLSIGISRGTMRVGAYGALMRRAFGALGDETNLAARLMQAAPPGEILISGRIAATLGEEIATQALPPIRVKGKAGLVRVYRPTRQQSTGVSQQSEIIGRHAEIARIEKILDEVQHGATRVLIVAGEAGIGKSRLVDKLKHLTRTRGLTWLIGNGQSIEQHTPYRAWRDVFNAYFDLENVSDAPARRARVESLVAQLAPAHAPRLPVLNDVLGLGIPENDLTQSFDANLRQQNVSLVLTALLRAWTLERPLVLIFEDAHWLDGLSWQLALEVARALAVAHAPCLFVLVNRPLDENSAGQKNFAALRALDVTQSLGLTALAPDEIIALIANRLNVAPDALPAPLIELVQTRANGNPFFAEELVFNLRDTNILTRHESRITLTQDLAQSLQTLPDTLHGLILSRIDRLPPQRQFVIKVAAVIGRAFAFAPLHHVVNRYVTMIDESLKDHLVALTRADFTFLETLEPELTYLFKHIITQEAAYQTLLFAQRRELHRIVAEWYESGLKDEGTLRGMKDEMGNSQFIPHPSSLILPLLAYHYRYAEDVAKEKHFLGLAADAAEKIFANDAAIGFYTRLLTLIPSQEQADILLKRAQVLDVVGRWEEKEPDLHAALALGKQTADLQVIAQTQYEIGNLFLQRSNYAAALEWCRRAQASFEALNDSTGRCRAIVTQGDILRRQGDNTSARQYLELGVQIARDTKNQWGIAQACLNLGNLYYNQNNFVQARESYTEALRAFRESNNKSGINKALNNLGMVADALGDRATMQALLEQSLAVSREIGDKAMIAMTLNNLGLAATRRKENELAVQLYHESLGLMREMGDRQRTAMVLRQMGDTLCKIGDYALAEARLQESLTLNQAIGYKRGVADALDSLGWLALTQDQYARARSWYEQSLVYAREWGYKSTTVATLYNLANVMIELDDYQTARTLYQESILLAREIQRTSSLPYILVGLTAITAHYGLHTDAARFSAALETWRASSTVQLDPLDQKFLARSIAQARAALSPAEFDAAWAEGAQLSLDQAIDQAMQS